MLHFQRQLNMVLAVVLLLAVLSCRGSGSIEPDSSASSAVSSNIEGTYKLVSRQLPDGNVLKPPQIVGLFTYSATHRNFNIVGEDAMGKFFLSIGGTYRLTPTEFSETRLFRIANDASDPKQIAYDVAEKTVTAPVKTAGGRIEFKFPGNEPTLVFEGTKLTATLEGSFVDAWEKVP